MTCSIRTMARGLPHSTIAHLSDEIAKRGIRVIVCGGRHLDNVAMVRSTLDAIDAERRIATIIEGGATGADTLARAWAGGENARQAAVTRITIRADWVKHGKAGGPIRNQRMLDETGPDLLVTFDGGAGTADMLRRAQRAGVEIIRARCS